MSKIIFLNGPPRSGKDTLGLKLALSVPWVRLYKLISPAEDFVRAVWRIPKEDFHVYREAHKNEPLSMFAGQSLREVFIRFSEQFMKPQFGSGIFGQLALRRLGQLADLEVLVVTDSGFVEEAIPLATHYGVSNCLKVELEREGCSFKGDSRSYWPPLPGMASVRIRNEGPIEEFAARAKYIILPFLNSTDPLTDEQPGLAQRTVEQ